MLETLTKEQIEYLVENKINKIYNWITSNEDHLKLDPNAFELVEILKLLSTSKLKLDGNPISADVQKKMDFIWENRKENIENNNLSYDSLFFNICESTYDGELAHINLTDNVKHTLKKMAAIDLYINQRRREEPMYMYDNETEIFEVATLIEEAKKEVKSVDYEKFVYEFEKVLTDPPSQYTK